MDNLSSEAKEMLCRLIENNAENFSPSEAKHAIEFLQKTHSGNDYVIGLLTERINELPF